MAYPLRMRGKDPETDEYLAPSRSQDRRDALEVLALGERLVALTDAQLARMPIPEDLLPHIRDTRRISSHIARKRQLAFLAKQMRREDEETLDAIRDALDEKGESARQETAAMHRAEAWRERLLPAVDAFEPQLLLVSAGFDGHRADPAAHLQLEADDYAWLTGELAEIARRHCGGRIVSTLEGGYDLPALAECGIAHLRALLAASG